MFCKFQTPKSNTSPRKRANAGGSGPAKKVKISPGSTSGATPSTSSYSSETEPVSSTSALGQFEFEEEDLQDTSTDVNHSANSSDFVPKIKKRGSSLLERPSYVSKPVRFCGVSFSLIRALVRAIFLEDCFCAELVVLASLALRLPSAFCLSLPRVGI